MLALGEVEVLEYPVLFGHGNQQHGGAGWNRFQALQYHTDLIPEKANLRDAVAFALVRHLDGTVLLPKGSCGE